MSQFFSVSHNSFYTKGFAWIQSLTTGFGRTYNCFTCKRTLSYSSGEMSALPDPSKGEEWPDVIGCGAYPFLIVSAKTIDFFEKEGIAEFPIHKVILQKPFPQRLINSPSPSYYWIDGANLIGAKMDFDASGFVGVKFCSECGTRSADIGATYDRQKGGKAPYIFIRNSWNGLQLFTTDLSHTAFFCTELVVNCAKKYRLTNFRFVPIQEGSQPDSSGLGYL